MKTLLIIGLMIATLLITAGIASASGWHRGYGHGHSHFSFGLFIAPPVYAVPPPMYYRGYSPPYGYGYYPRSYRVWVPGYWGWRQSPYGWGRAWVPGYWDWR
jgi:hypothetical protein